METQTTAEADRLHEASQVRLMSLFYALGLVSLALLAPIIYLIFDIEWLTWVLIFVFFTILVLLFQSNYTRRVEPARTLIFYVAAFTEVALVCSGAIYGAPIFMILPLFITFYLAMNHRAARRIILTMFIAFFVIYCLALLQVITIPYSKLAFGVFLFGYIIAIFCFEGYGRERDSLDRRIKSLLKQNDQLIQSLQNEKTNIEHKVLQRTRQLNETKTELTASIRSLPFGFAIVTKDHKITIANDQLRQLLRITDEVTLGSLQTQFAKTIKLETLVHKSIEQKRTLEHNIMLNESYFRIFITPIINQRGHSIGAVLIVEDTTEQKALERARDEFFSIASHELRTPLTAIRGNADIIRDYYKEPLKDPELHQMVDDIHASSVRLIDIVNDFLDTSRLEQGRIEFKFEPFDIQDLVSKTIHEYSVTTSRRKIALELTPPAQQIPLAYGDPNRIRQIIINLVGNALKFTRKGSITLSLTVENRHIKLLITDTGQGIPDSSKHLLFRKFQQATGNILTRDNTRGTGLGLYISRMLANKMGGDVQLEWSEVGKGSTFSITLPIATEKQPNS